MAYEALDNLQQTLDLILEHRDDLLPHYVKREIISIRDQSVVLQMNLKHYPNKERIREEASKIHEVIQYFFSEENVSIKPAVRLTDRLRELAALLESIVGDVVDCIKGKGSASSVESTVGDVADYIKGKSSISSKDDDVVGFGEDVEVIKDRLLEGSSRLQVIPIVGRGGIGKTTLAKIVYNHPSVVEYFHISAWVTISQDHSVERIVLNLLASMKEISAVGDAESDVPGDAEGDVPGDAESDVPIESLIRKHLELKFRRYLIVMDDMWSKKAWDDVKSLFPDVDNYSRIIITTRMQDVADYVSSFDNIHTMRLLDAYDSWNLLSGRCSDIK